MKQETITFRVGTDEKQSLLFLTNHLQRTRSDAIRWVIREAAAALKAEIEETAVSEQNQN